MAWFRCMGGSGGEQYTIQFGKYAKFSGSAGFILPYTINSDYKVTVVFYEDTYANDAAVIGNTSGSYYSHLTEYNSRWYTSSGTRETSFGSWVGQTEHTYINNNGNSKNEFDGVEVTDYTPTTDVSYYYTIGCRGTINSNKYSGYIGYYKIESLSTGNAICELRPALVRLNGDVIKTGLYDTVNKLWYGENCITNITEPYDPPISSNCRISQGTFTTPSVIDDTITINCGFVPDFIKVLMDFGNSQTTAYYFKTDNEDNEEISVWDLRPTEGAIYQIFDPSGSVTNETGICEITVNGFKYKAHGSNTTDKACTYIAYKFNEVQPPQYDEDAFYQNGTWLHPEDMTMLVTGGSVDASGNLYFDSTTDICGVSTDDLIDEGKYKYVFFVRNMSSTTLTAQFGSCTPGYTTQQIIGTGQGRGGYSSASVAPGDRGVFVYDINHAGGTSGVFAGMYPTNNPWQIEKILRIPIT